MPLFLDLHKASDYETKPTVEDIKKNHIADLATQHKYGVRFIQYWINEDDGLVFCMMEAPDKEACAAVHREAHGAMPCNVIELKGGDYEAFMGNEGKVNEFDIVENADGSLDSGSRTLVAVDVLLMKNSSVTSKLIRSTLKEHKGREVIHNGERIIGSFNTSDGAIGWAIAVMTVLKKQRDVEVQIGISSGHPVTDKNNFFELAMKQANRLCEAAVRGKIIIGSGVKGGSSYLVAREQAKHLLKLNVQLEKFLNGMFDVLNESLQYSDFNIGLLSRKIGVSPAQLYRKTVLLTGVSPNNLLKELRLRRSVLLLKEKYGNIAEVAYESGFSNPSYFTLVFQKRFGLLPSQFIHTAD